MRIYTWLLCLLFAFICNTSSVSAEDNVIIIDDIIVTDEICELRNGTLTVVINNPSPGLIYSVDAGLTFQDSNYFNNLGSGDYLVVVRDAISCSNAFSIQIVDAPLPKVTIEFSCVQDLNKVNIDLTPFADGIQPFTYRWEGPNNSSYDTQNLNQVDPGEYSVTVTDRLGCQIDTDISIPICCSMTVDCDISDTIRVNCMKDIPTANSAFLDNMSNGDEDLTEIIKLGVSIDDQCSDINVSVADNYDINQNCNQGPLVYKRVYTIDDGVTRSDCESIILIDNYKGIEVEKSPEELRVSCDDDVVSELEAWVADMAGAVVATCSGDFSVRTIPDIYSVAYTCEGSGDVELEFIITDECDNELSFISTFSVSDITPPSIECPATLDIIADQQDFDLQVSNWLQSYISDDNCSSVTVSDNYDIDNLTYECAEESLSVRFESTDDCGNSSECTSTIFITQVFIPTIACPEALVVQCDGDNNDLIINEWIGLASGEGYNNAPIAIANDFDIVSIEGLSCSTPMAVRFYAEELCLQDIECLTSIELVDETSPIIDCPPALILENGDTAYESKINDWLQNVTATDNCSQAKVSNNFNIAELDFCNNDGDMTVEFAAIDDCDNVTICEASIELTPYSFSIECPDAITIDCIDDAQIIIDQWLAQGIGIENEIDTLLLANDFLLSNLNTDCDGITQVNFSIDSGCDGLATCSSTIQIVDDIAPIITCPQSITIEVDSDTKDQDIALYTESAVAIDDCHDVMISHDWQSITDIECSEDVKVVFVATDACSNTADCFSILTLVSTTSPEIMCPDTFYAYCDDKLLDDKIRGHLSRVEVSSTIEYDIFNDLDLDLIDRNCEEEYSTDIAISVIDACGKENSCNTTLHIYPPPRVYIPNVFIPESNTADEIFTVYSNSSVVEVKSLLVYDRWGSLVFEAENIPPNDESYGWDGIFNGLVEKSNIMTYHIILEGVMGEELEYAGTIQVMK